jgi:hypothetical protein
MVVDAGVLVGVLVASVGVVAARPTWRVARYPVTAVHEFGHLIVAVAVGGRRPTVRLAADTSGRTSWKTASSGRGRAGLIALAGPATPPLVGAACAAAFASNQPILGVVGLAAIVGTVSLAIRNLWGAAVCGALGAICWWAWRYGVSSAQILMLVSATVLCVGGARAVTEEMATSSRGGFRDTQVAAAALRLPPPVWGTLLLVWALACTGWAARRVATAI